MYRRLLKTESTLIESKVDEINNKLNTEVIVTKLISGVQVTTGNCTVIPLLVDLSNGKDITFQKTNRLFGINSEQIIIDYRDDEASI